MHAGQRRETFHLVRQPPAAIGAGAGHGKLAELRAEILRLFTVLPFTVSVISEAEAVEMAQPRAWKAASAMVPSGAR